MDKIARIRQAIERRKGYISVTHFAEELLSFLDTLKEEPDKSLEEAADSAAIKAFPEKKAYSTVVDRVVDYNAIDRKNYRDGFIAGSEWGAEHSGDKKTISYGTKRKN